MALRGQPYIPLYVLDFMTDEKLRECSAESVGVYIMLMCVLHKQETYGALTLREKDKTSESQVRNFAVKLIRQLPYDADTIERGLNELLDEGVLSLDGDTLFQKRMVRDGDISQKRASAGKSSRSKSKAEDEQSTEQNESKTSSKIEANSEAKIQQNAEYEIEDENEIEVTEESVSSVAKKQEAVDQRFESFWKAYPRKVGKGAARKLWKRIHPTQELFEKMMAALETAKCSRQWTKDNGEFIPHPATWLNQERWEDGDTNSGQPAFDPENPFAEWGEGA